MLIIIIMIEYFSLEDYILQNGTIIKDVKLAYQTYGALNQT